MATPSVSMLGLVLLIQETALRLEGWSSRKEESFMGDISFINEAAKTVDLSLVYQLLLML